jgi:hypothetical protein
VSTRRGQTPHRQPSVTPFGDYVVDGRIDVALSGGTATDFVLRRI